MARARDAVGGGGVAVTGNYTRSANPLSAEGAAQDVYDVVTAVFPG